MSVSISINGNREFCASNGLVELRNEDCFCEDELGRPAEDCPYCGGMGYWIEEIYPFEMNMANRNFATLWNSLGIDLQDFCGEIDGRVILAAMAVGTDLVLREEKTEIGLNGAMTIDFGIKKAQADRYFEILRAIAEEAVKREEKVCWC